MTSIIKLMTLNINGIQTDNKIQMLENMLRQQGIDIALMQEVTNNKLASIRGYTIHINEGTEKRGTAIAIKDGIQTTDLKRLTTGRGMAVKYEDIWIVNIYAPSGAEKRAEREQFFNTGIMHILPQTNAEMILAGDFNCTVEKSENTGGTNHSRALKELITGLGLKDGWDPKTMKGGYTHITAKSASRIDRIYTTQQLTVRKTGIETIPAAFSDHNAVTIRIATDKPPPTRGRGYWKMNTTLLQEKTFRNKLAEEWANWKTKMKYYQTTAMWWTRCVKQRIKILFTMEGAERQKERRNMESFYYAAINEILRDGKIGQPKITKLKELKAKIIRLQSKEQQKRLLDIGEADRYHVEKPSIYHLMKTRQRQKKRNITSITDENGNKHDTNATITRTFANHLRKKYGKIDVDIHEIAKMKQNIPTQIPKEANTALEERITMEELETAIRSGKNKKAPGIDGICQEFYKTQWKTIKHDLLSILQQMHTHGKITPQQKRGIMVCLPKTPTPKYPEEYRVLTLLNTDIKIMARIIAKRLDPWFPQIIHPGQHCGVQGKSILDATATIRDAIAYAETMNKKVCILSLDFKAAFDNVAHTYLYEILRAHGLSTKIQEQIQSMYEEATASVQINGHISTPIPILSSIRQGCPLSMHLYALCLNPLLHMLDTKLSGIQTDPTKQRTAIIAYADDVTLFITSQDELEAIQDALKCYQKASGAEINLKKSKAMAIGGWDTKIDIMGIQYKNKIKILGIEYHTETERTINDNWDRVTKGIRLQASEVYSRDLEIDQRICYVHEYLLAKAWYIAQMMPLPITYERQINTIINWFVWKGEIFKVPISTLQKPKKEGGWDLVNVAAKSRMLYYHRTMMQGRKEGTLSAGWLRKWGADKRSQNPPNRNNIPPNMEYIRIIIIDSAYIEEQGKEEKTRAYRRRMYNTMKSITSAKQENGTMRIQKYWPNYNWQTIWENLHMTPVTNNTKGVWYKVIHDIIPTNERLKKIRLSPTDLCQNCNDIDTTQHRITDCGEGRETWKWISDKIAIIMRIDPRYIPKEWVVRPNFRLWPPKKHRAILWTIATLVLYRGQRRRELTNIDFMDFLRRQKWKTYQNPKRGEQVGNYLSVFDP
jgi:endonuclease/exonuclease/phosphatase family metal-dependent hydrolase